MNKKDNNARIIHKIHTQEGIHMTNNITELDDDLLENISGGNKFNEDMLTSDINNSLGAASSLSELLVQQDRLTGVILGSYKAGSISYDEMNHLFNRLNNKFSSLISNFT